MLRSSRDIIVIGGSAGAARAITAILAELPPGFPAAVFVVLHRQASSSKPDRLRRVLGQNARLPVVTACDGSPIESGRVYLAPGDDHLLLENGIMRLERSPLEHRFRPCADVLFRSAAAAYGRRVIAVLLSGGFGNDGTAGLWQVRSRGGVTIVQDPDDAEFAAMPVAALVEVAVDHVLSVTRIGPKLADLVASSAPSAPGAAPQILIVEDESVVATNLQHSLVEMGYDVIDWVPTGEAALDSAEREHPDLILMDIHLAGALSGIEAARRIWHKLQIPVVYCTAHADVATLKSVQTTESYGYVVKPFQTAAVRAAVELALARRERELR